MFNFLKPKPPRYSSFGQFLRTNCKTLWIHEDGAYDLMYTLTGCKKRLHPSADRVSFALYGTMDLSRQENVDILKLCIETGIEIYCNTITIFKSKEPVK